MTPDSTTNDSTFGQDGSRHGFAGEKRIPVLSAERMMCGHRAWFVVPLLEMKSDWRGQLASRAPAVANEYGGTKAERNSDSADARRPCLVHGPVETTAQEVESWAETKVPFPLAASSAQCGCPGREQGGPVRSRGNSLDGWRSLPFPGDVFAVGSEKVDAAGHRRGRAKSTSVASTHARWSDDDGDFGDARRRVECGRTLVPSGSLQHLWKRLMHSG
jgi:hypothetical protein